MEFQIFTEEQAWQFLIVASGSPYETVFYLALTTEMRKGELLGPKWADLDWDTGPFLFNRLTERLFGCQERNHFVLRTLRNTTNIVWYNRGRFAIKPPLFGLLSLVIYAIQCKSGRIGAR